MIDRQHGKIVYECDACEEPLETGEREFKDALVIFRREGWKAERVGTEWVHTCPDCMRR